MVSNPQSENSNNQSSKELAKELEMALNGARQHLQALRQSAEWEDTEKRRIFLDDLSNRLKSIIRQIEKELADIEVESSD